jgi:hypothetical protein
MPEKILTCKWCGTKFAKDLTRDYSDSACAACAKLMVSPQWRQESGADALTAAVIAAARVVVGALSDERDMDRLRAALAALDARKDTTDA